MTGSKNYLGLIEDSDSDLLHLGMGSDEIMAYRVVEEGDKEDYGVKGMKWGVRRSSAQLKGESTSSGKKEVKGTSTDSGGIKGTSTAKGDASEPSAERYAKMREQAALGKAKAWKDDDLKWFNARTEALAKVEKLNKNKPGWIKSTAKEVLQRTTQQAIQNVATEATTRFITIPINESIGKAAAKSAAERAAKAALKKK